MRIYRVTVGVEGGETRVLKVPSKTDVQAADAAAPLMSPGESIPVDPRDRRSAAGGRGRGPAARHPDPSRPDRLTERSRRLE